MATPIIIAILLLLAAALALVAYSLIIMASRGERAVEEFEAALPNPGTWPAAPPAPEGYTWCAACQAMFAGQLCPGCTPDQALEAGYYPNSRSDPRD